MAGENAYQAIVIGASAGGIAALRKLFSMLPDNFEIPIIIVQHLPKNPSVQLADILASWTEIPVLEAEAGCPIENGKFYVAPPDYHLLIEPDLTFALNVDEPVHWSRPSIDVLFETAAEIFRQGLIAIILTGANDDGAAGLKKIDDCGGTTIVQKPETAEVDKMPLAALELVPTAMCMSPEEIGRFLGRLAY